MAERGRRHRVPHLEEQIDTAVGPRGCRRRPHRVEVSDRAGITVVVTVLRDTARCLTRLIRRTGGRRVEVARLERVGVVRWRMLAAAAELRLARALAGIVGIAAPTRPALGGSDRLAGLALRIRGAGIVDLEFCPGRQDASNARGAGAEVIGQVVVRRRRVPSVVPGDERRAVRRTDPRHEAACCPATVDDDAAWRRRRPRHAGVDRVLDDDVLVPGPGVRRIRVVDVGGVGIVGGDRRAAERVAVVASVEAGNRARQITDPRRHGLWKAGDLGHRVGGTRTGRELGQHHVRSDHVRDIDRPVGGHGDPREVPSDADVPGAPVGPAVRRADDAPLRGGKAVAEGGVHAIAGGGGRRAIRGDVLLIRDARVEAALARPAGEGRRPEGEGLAVVGGDVDGRRVVVDRAFIEVAALAEGH